MKNTYFFSSYWGTWSRRLGKNPRGDIVEVNLTPIRCAPTCTWENHVKPVVIQAHFTDMHEGDILQDHLPHKIIEVMVDNLGPEFFDYLLTEDFLPQIDWALYDKHCNGGCPFEKCRKAL
jgi:hypothetical protein